MVQNGVLKQNVTALIQFVRQKNVHLNSNDCVEELSSGLIGTNSPLSLRTGQEATKLTALASFQGLSTKGSFSLRLGSDTRASLQPAVTAALKPGSGLTKQDICFAQRLPEDPWDGV